MDTTQTTSSPRQINVDTTAKQSIIVYMDQTNRSFTHPSGAPAAVVVFFVLLFLYTKFVGAIPLSISSVTTTKTDTFSVTGQGEVSVIPDTAVVSAGVSEQGSTVSEAQNSLNSRINAVSDSVKNLGIDPSDIKTTNYNISPRYNRSREGSQEIVGYNASSNLVIRVKNIDEINQVIDTATENGANVVGNVRFEIDDPDTAEKEARKLAVEDAKQKAREAAEIANFRLGKLVNYSEGRSGGPVLYDFDARAASFEAASAPTAIEPGSSDVVVTVTLHFEIE